MHLSQGEIRAYQDRELDREASNRVEDHLNTCDACRRQAQELSERAQRVEARLSSLAPRPDSPGIPLRMARMRLAARLEDNEKEQSNMLQKMFSRLSRPAWAALAVVALLAVSLSFPSVRAIANSFLGLFRVQQFSVVQFDENSLPQSMANSSQMEVMFSRDVKVEQEGEPTEVATPEEASALAGFPLRLPTNLEGDRQLSKLLVSPKVNASLTVDMEHVRLLLEELGRSDIQLPEELDGSKVEVDVPAGVSAGFGNCDSAAAEEARRAGEDPDDPATRYRNCTLLVQMPSPTITAPEGLDIAQLGSAYLQLLGLSQTEAVLYAKNIDWTTTFVIPLPRGKADYSTVTVDGVNATLIQQYGQSNLPQYALLWVKDGMVYSLAGRGSIQTALKIANSLQ